MTSQVCIYTKLHCPFCTRALTLLKRLNISSNQLKEIEIEIQGIEHENKLRQDLLTRTGQKTFPNIFIAGKHLPGGCDGLFAAWRSGDLYRQLASAAIVFTPWTPPVYGFPKLDHFGGKDRPIFHDENNSWWYIQEKIDGSQLSFRLDPYDCKRVIFTNRLKEICQELPADAVFGRASEAIRKIASQLKPGYTYCCEAVEKLRHQQIMYKRLPAHYVLVYDIMDVFGNYLWPTDMAREAKAAGLECVPTLYENKQNDDTKTNPVEEIKRAIKLQSCLGGNMEGVVLKHPYFQTKGKHVALKQKYVTDEFKESHKLKHQNHQLMAPMEFFKWLGNHYKTEARARKAVQHLSERNVKAEDFKNSEIWNDELDRDLLSEHSRDIGQALWSYCQRFFQSYQTNSATLKPDPYAVILHTTIRHAPVHDQMALVLQHCLNAVLEATRPSLPL